MPRSPAALLILLASLVGCDEGSDARRIESAAAAATPAWFPAAPFRDDIRLPAASQARPWQPPAEGPVPVVEILRDGSWVLDGEPVEGEGDVKRNALEVRLREAVIRMPKERLAPDLDSGPRIPANPVLVRVDREAPWEALQAVIEICHGWRTQISTVELHVGPQDPVALLTLSLPMARDFGTVCVDGGAWAWSWLLLEAGSDLEGLSPDRTPAPVALLVPDYVRGQAEDRTTTVVCDSAFELTGRLRKALQESWREISLDLPPRAPAWLAVAALDLGTRAGVDLWGFPPLPDSPARGW
jgi:hypothetical protein